MKKIFFSLCSLALVSCSGQKANDNAENNTTDATQTEATCTLDIVGKWNIDEALGKSTEGAETPAFITFNDNGEMNGNASVNSFFGGWTLTEGDSLKFSNVGMTKMMGASMEIEDAVSAALDSIATLQFDGEKLNALNANRQVVMVLSRCTEEEATEEAAQ